MNACLKKKKKQARSKDDAAFLFLVIYLHGVYREVSARDGFLEISKPEGTW